MNPKDYNLDHVFSPIEPVSGSACQRREKQFSRAYLDSQR
jgi:hypothetical protein